MTELQRMKSLTVLTVWLNLIAAAYACWVFHKDGSLQAFAGAALNISAAWAMLWAMNGSARR